MTDEEPIVIGDIEPGHVIVFDFVAGRVAIEPSFYRSWPHD